MKNKSYKEVQYLQYNCSGYFKSKQKGERRSKSNQVVNLRPFYVINDNTNIPMRGKCLGKIRVKCWKFGRLPDKSECAT